MKDREKRLEVALRDLLDDLKSRAKMYRHHPSRDVRAHYSNPQGETVIPVSDGRLAKAEEALADYGTGGDKSWMPEHGYDSFPDDNDARNRLVLMKFSDGYLPHYGAGRTNDRREAWVAPHWLAKRNKPTGVPTAFVLATPDDRANCTIHSGHYGDSVMYTKGEKPKPPANDVLGEALKELEVVTSLINSPRCQIAQKEWAGYRSLLDDIKRALTAQHNKPGRIPEGWKLVPVEPTEEMLYAGMPHVGETVTIRRDEYKRRVHGINPELWKAMIAAAPTPDADERE